MTDHAALGLQYAQDIVAGTIPACRWVKLACQRHLDDLDRQSTPGFKFKFDSDRGSKICRFIERLPHIKGPLDGQRIKLEPWQCWILTSVYGWLCDGGPRDGKRRYRRVYLEMPRGQGKSALSSGVGLYALSADGEGGAEVYSLATTRAQAGIVHKDAQRMARKSKPLMDALGVEVAAHQIRVPKTGSKFEALSSEGGTLDGLNVHLGIIDELHAHKSREVYDVIETAIGKRDQSMLWCITTAGTNRAGICFELRTYLTKVLNGSPDESYFGVIYTIDDTDQWFEESSWIKANPNYGVSVQPDIVAQLCSKAMQMPSAKNNFLTKHLCVWVHSDSSWMDMRKWDQVADYSLDIRDFEGEHVTIGMDLATRNDMTAKVYVFQKELQGITHYYVFGQYYLPMQAIIDGRNSQYSGWESEAHIVANDGDMVDYDNIEDTLYQDHQTYQIDEVAFDPFNAPKVVQHLMAHGIDCIEVKKNVANFNAPMKELEALIYQGRLHHDGNPVLTWMMSNVVCHLDRNDNVFPNKDGYENKIDGVDALITALARILVRDSDGYSYYENNPVLFV